VIILGEVYEYRKKINPNMMMSLFPKTIWGWWSIGLAVFYILFYVFSTLILGKGPEYNTELTVILTITGAGIAAAAAITGIFGVVKGTERAVLTYLSTVIGIYCLVGCIVSLSGKIQ
jgi:hypothetical protein